MGHLEIRHTSASGNGPSSLSLPSATPYRSLSQPPPAPQRSQAVLPSAWCLPSPTQSRRAIRVQPPPGSPGLHPRDFLQPTALPGPPCSERPCGSSTCLCHLLPVMINQPVSATAFISRKLLALRRESEVQLNFVCRPTERRAIALENQLTVSARAVYALCRGLGWSLALEA